MRFFLLLAAAALASAGLSYPTAVALKAADGTALAAAWGVPAKSAHGVVLVHQYGRNKEDWQFLAQELVRDGNAVIAVDLRGHGQSVGAVPRDLSPADFAAMQLDVRAAVAQLRGKGVSKFSLVGAELGANLAINVAVDEPGVVSAVMLSPGLDYRGVIAGDSVKRYGNRPLLLVASADDAYAARSAGVLDTTAVGEHEFRLLDGAGRGTKMLNREPALQGWLVGWIKAHWSPPPPATPAPELRSVDIRPADLGALAPVTNPP